MNWCQACWHPPAASARTRDSHAQALHRLRDAHAALLGRVARILVNRRDRDKEIVELHRARQVGRAHDAAKLRRLLAKRHMCDRSAARLEEIATVIEQQMQHLEDAFARQMAMQALRGGLAAGAEQERLMGGLEQVDRVLAELQRQQDSQSDVQKALDEFNEMNGMPDAEAEEELHRLIEEEHIEEQFSRTLAALEAAPGVPDDSPEQDDADVTAGLAMFSLS